MGLLDRFQQAARVLTSGVEEAPLAAAPFAPAADVVSNPNDIRKTSRSSVAELWQSTNAMVNAVTGAGTNRDPSFFNRWAIPTSLGEAQRFGMGRNALIYQALSKLPKTAAREGWRLNITDETIEGAERVKIADMVAAYEERLSIGARTARSVSRGRQYGQSFVLLGIDDGRPFNLPVDRNVIRTIKWSAVMDVRHFQPIGGYLPTEEHFSEVKTFQITDIQGVLEDGLRNGPDALSNTQTELETEQQRQNGQLIVHADRVLYFPTEDYLPLLDSLQDVLGAFFEATGGIRTAARESSTVVYKISNFIRKMWSENGHLASAHMGFVDRAKSSMNAWVIDKDNEEVQVISRSLAGVSNLADPFMVWLAAALGIPVTVLWGVSPGGFGKGESERETWHEEVRAFQTGVLTPQLQKLHSYILAADDGGGFGLRKVQREIKYTDLSPPDEQESSQLRTAAIGDLVTLADKGFITRDEIRASLPELVDPYFQLTLTEEGERVSKDALVGAITGAIALAQATVPESTPLPVDTVERLLARLIPSSFDAEGAAFAFAPIKTLLNPPEPTSTPTGGTPPPGEGAAPGQIPADEEDAAAEPDEPTELDIAWSEAEPPADAATAKAIVESGELGEVTTRQIKIMANAGELPAYRGRGFSKEPLFSPVEVRKALLTRQGHLAASAEESDAPATPAADAAPGSLFVSLRLPKELAQWVPWKAEDTSAPHVTLLYVYDTPAAMVPEVIAALESVLANVAPFGVSYTGDVNYFDQSAHPTKPRDGRIAHVPASMSIDPQALFDSLALVVESMGLEVSRFDPFAPHTTLAYIDGDADYTGPRPTGSWLATEIEVSHDSSDAHVITLNDLPVP